MRPRSAQRARRGGFTFVEILAAMLFMSIVIPVAMQGILLANRVGVATARKRVASELADTKLNELFATGDWQSGSQSGDFGDDFPGYEWSFETQSWEGDTVNSLTELTVTVTYKVQGSDFDVALSTLADETDTSLEEAPSSTTSSSSSSSGTGGGQ